MLPRSSASGRTPRLTWEPSSDNLAAATPAAEISLQSRTGPQAAAAAAKTDSTDTAGSSGAVNASAQLGAVSMRPSPGARHHHYPPPPPPQQEQERRLSHPQHRQQQLGGKSVGAAPKPLTAYHRHDNAAYDTGAGYDADGRCCHGGGCDDGSLRRSSGERKSRVSILLRSDPAAAAVAAAGPGTCATCPAAPTTTLAPPPAAAVAAHQPGGTSPSSSSSWAPAPPSSAPTHAPRPPHTNSARLAAAAAAAAAADLLAPPHAASTLPYAASRPLLCGSDGAASTDEANSDDDDANAGRRSAHAHLQPHAFAGTSSAALAAVVAGAAAGGGASRRLLSLPFPLHRTDDEGNPMLPTPPLSLRSSFAASFASSTSNFDLSQDRVSTPEPLQVLEQPVGNAATDATAASSSAAVTPSWGSAGDLRSGDSSAAGIVCSAADEAAASSSSRGSRSNLGGSSSRSGHGREKTCSPGNYGACRSGGGGGGNSSGDAGPFAVATAAAAASLPSTPSTSAGTSCGAGIASASAARGPKRVQLSISFLPPSSPTPQSQPAPASASASSAAGSPSSTTATFVIHSEAAPQPPPPPLLRLAEATSITMHGHPPWSETMTSAAGATTAAAAVAVAAAPAAGDGVVLVSDAAAAITDLDDIDLVANISVAAVTEAEAGALLREGGAEGDPAVEGASVAAAAAGAGGDGEDGAAAAGALPPEVRRRLNGHMGRQRAKSIRNWKDLSHSMASQPPGYWLLSTMLLLLVMVGAFLFMAGQYEFVRPIDVSDTSSSSSQATGLEGDPLSSYSWGPASLRGWLTFWRSPAARTFTFDYLRTWGGRYGPDLAAGQWWRWVTSLLLHQNSMHLASNTALFLVLSAYLESLFGFWRVLPVWVVAGVAGNMVSAFFESPCMLVVGSSGAVFGLLGAYTADAALNFESIPLLWLRLAGMAAVAALLVALQVTGHSSGGRGSSTSHASHIGGFLAGVMTSLLLTPDFKAKRSKKVTDLLRAMGVGGHLPDPASPGGRQLYSFWQRHRALLYGMYGIVIVVLLMMLVGLPLALYLRTFKRMVCG